MATTASIIIEVNEVGAVAKLAAVNAEAAKLGPTLQPVQHISEQTFNNIETGALRARESAALLGEEFGVKIPRALRGTIAEAAGIGPIFSAAFSGLAILGFIEIAKVAGEKIAEVVANLMGWGEEVKKAMDAQIELNKVFVETEAEIEKLQKAYRLIGLQGLQLLSEKQKVANEDLDEAKKKVTDLTAAIEKQNAVLLDAKSRLAFTMGQPSGLTADVKAMKAAEDGISTFGRDLAEAQERVKKLAEALKYAGKETSSTFSKERTDAIREMGTAAHEALTKVQAMLSGTAKAGAGPEEQIDIELKAKQEELAKILVLYGDDERVRSQVAIASVAIEKEARDKRIKLLTDEADAKLRLLQEEQDQEEQAARHQAERLRRMEDETLSIERSAAIAMAPPWERANTAIVANYEERMAKIRELVKTGDLDEEHAARMQTAALQELYAQRRDALASQMEGLYNDITSGNIKKRFMDMFKKMIFEMVAAWIIGMQGMRNASQQQMGSGGGILGAIFGSMGLGGIFGGGGQAGPGVSSTGPGGTPPFIGDFTGNGSGGLVPWGNEGTATPLAGVGLSAGQGAGGLGTTLPSGAGPGGGIGGMGGPLGDLLGKVFSHGAGPISGSMLGMAGISLLAASWRKGGVLGGLGGAAGGALTGFAIGGPIGAIIGGIAGFIAGIWGHSTKKARLEIEANIKNQAKAIEDAYNLFQMDWPTSRSQLEQLRLQGVDALKQAGVKDISRSRVGHVDHWIDQAEKEIDLTQAERNRRNAMVFGPPQFRVGGFVGPGLGGPMPDWFAGTAMHFADGGAVPAILHQGEFVMRPEAVSRIGVGNLASMNSGGGAGGEVHNHFYINAIDTTGFEEFLDRGGMVKIMRQARRGQIEGKW